MPTAAAIVGSSLISGYFGNKGAKKQVRGQRKAIDAVTALQQPFVDAGVNAIPGVQDFVSEGANYADTQAFKDITNSARAGGQFGSGNRATALTDYYATNYRPQRLNELMSLVNVGQGSAASLAGMVGGLNQNIGTIQGRNATNMGNTINSGINSLVFLNRLNKLSGGGGFNDSLSINT